MNIKRKDFKIIFIMRAQVLSIFLVGLPALLSEEYLRPPFPPLGKIRPAVNIPQRTGDAAEESEYVSSDVFLSLSSQETENSSSERTHGSSEESRDSLSFLRDSPLAGRAPDGFLNFRQTLESKVYAPLRRVLSKWSYKKNKPFDSIDPCYFPVLWLLMFVFGCNMFVLGYRQKTFNTFAVSYFYMCKPVYLWLKKLPKIYRKSWIRDYEWFKAFKDLTAHTLPLLFMCFCVCLGLAAFLSFCIQKFLYISILIGNALIVLLISRSEIFVDVDPVVQLGCIICAVVLFLFLFKFTWGRVEKCFYFFIFALFSTLFILLSLSEIFNIGLYVPSYVLNYKAKSSGRNLSGKAECILILVLAGLSIFMQTKGTKFRFK